MIDLDALEKSIAEGEKKNFFVAPIVKELIAELRHARGERAAVVAWLLDYAHQPETYAEPGFFLRVAAAEIERGEHRREEEKR